MPYPYCRGALPGNSQPPTVMSIHDCVRHQLRALAALTTVLGLAPLATAQTAPSTVSPADLAKYDTNHNGRLDPNELAARDRDRRMAADAASSDATTGTSSAGVVKMSPFQVQADNDKGYFGANTLSGTRINSKITDLASSITVVTKQQLEDTAAVDINDIFEYEANTEGTNQYTEFSVDRNGGVNDSVQSSPTTANRIRGIASANIALDNFASDSSIPVDTYNLDGVEISRGPNSNIFGLGNASGTVNLIPAQANLTRDTNKLTLRGDSYGGYRGVLDLNRQIVAGKLAARIIGLYDSTGYLRKPSKDITRRLNAMFTLHPFDSTTIYGSYESYNEFQRRPNYITPGDTVTYWKSVGSPTWDPTTWTAHVNGKSIVVPVGSRSTAESITLPPGLYTQGTGTYNRPSMYIDNGAVQYWSVNRTSNTSNPNNPNTDVRMMETGTDIMRNRGSTMPLFVSPHISDKSLYDWSKINFVAPNYAQKKADTYRVTLEQFFINTPMNLLAMQAGWFRQRVNNFSRNFISGNSATVFVDVNEKLLNGQPNPYFLRPYIGASEPTTFDTPSLNDNGRVQLAYQLDLTKAKSRWLQLLGTHRVSGYLEGRRITSGTYRFREIVTDNHTWINPANRANGNAIGRAYFRYYLGDANGQNIDYAAPPLYGVSGTYNLNWYNGATKQWISEPATMNQEAYLSSRNEREIRSRGAVLQSFWLGDRIVTTVGTRRDRNRSRDSNSNVIDPTTGLYDNSPLNVWQNWQEQAGTTSTRGVVVRPFRNWGFIRRAMRSSGAFTAFASDLLDNLNFYYNTSNTFQPAPAQYNLFGDLLPSPTGVGRDWGVDFTMFHGKVYLKVNHYVDKQLDSRNGDSRIIATRANRLDFGSDHFNLYGAVHDWETQLHPTYTADQLDAATYQLMQLPLGFAQAMRYKSIGETQDESSEGWEFEANYNPTPNWTLKVTGSKQRTIDSALSPNIQRYLDQRMPVWTSIKIPTDTLPGGGQIAGAGDDWWTTRYGSSGTPESFYIGAVLAPYKLATANQGKPRSQVRQWHWSALTNLHLAALHTGIGWINRTSIGGSVRWESRASIGFYGAAPDPDGVIRSYDPNRPVFDSPHTYVDLFASHAVRLFHNRVTAHIQLNIRNVFENGGLQAIAVNPDGSPYAYRIIDPRQFILTTTFDF